MAASVIPASGAAVVGSGLQRAVTRRAIEDQIEVLITALDELDGDADSEEDDPAEASLGWSLTYAIGTNDEREEDAIPFDPGPKFPRRITPAKAL